MELIFIGDGEYALPNLPPHDLTAQEVEASQYSPQQIVASGLYKFPDQAPALPPVQPNPNPTEPQA